MSIEPKGPARKPRADGQRNRERLMEAAKAMFADMGTDVGLDEIARRAGVGIGTLYRHFPTRDAIVEAVYRCEVEQLAGSATRLLGSSSPGEALHQWMRLFVDYIATKKVMAAALGSIVSGAPELYASSATQITDAMFLLVDRARAIGDIRPDVERSWQSRTGFAGRQRTGKAACQLRCEGGALSGGRRRVSAYEVLRRRPAALANGQHVAKSFHYLAQ
jgi:AcrR family transcriptional regulator